MTTESFDRALYGAMSVAELAAAFEEIVGEPPEKRNKLWMLKRMEQAASAREAARRAAEGPPGRSESEAGGSDLEAGAEGEGAPLASELALPAAEGTRHEGDIATGGESVRTALAAASAPVAVSTSLDRTPVVVSDPGPEGGERSEPQDAGTAPLPTASGVVAEVQKPVRRRYIPARFRSMTLDEIHALFAERIGRPTKSSDVPYLCWRITRAERVGVTASPTGRRTRSTNPDGTSRGEARAVTLREYPDTLEAVQAVCVRHGMRNRLEFFRRAARHYLEQLGEAPAAAYFAEGAPAVDAPADG